MLAPGLRGLLDTAVERDGAVGEVGHLTRWIIQSDSVFEVRTEVRTPLNEGEQCSSDLQTAVLGTVVATGQCPSCQGLHPVSLPGCCCMVKRMVLESLPCSTCWPSSGGLIAQTQAPLPPCPGWFYLLFCFSRRGFL